MRFRLRTLLLVLALGPVVLWVGHGAWNRYLAWRERQLNQVKTTDLIGYPVPPGWPVPTPPFPPEPSDEP